MSIMYCFESGQESSFKSENFSLLNSVFVSIEPRLQIVHVSLIGDSYTSEPTVVAPSGNKILRELSQVTHTDVIFILTLRFGISQNIQFFLKLRPRFQKLQFQSYSASFWCNAQEGNLSRLISL